MTYPESPLLLDRDVTKPSPSFVRETYKVGFSILGFILVYLVLLVLASALAAGAGYAGYLVITNRPGLFTLMIGAALCLFGIFILIYILKFVATRHTNNEAHLVEISKNTQPEICEFINRVVQEVGSQFPKKIFLSNEVNAYVFYNSSFWSLFFPVKKNLVLGLGLINSINISEFKAILAHEFGHFSQKSMKLGSYIYYVNRIIHELLYNNQSFEESVSKVSEKNGYLALAGALTFAVIRSIQFVLQLIYKPINKMYLALSREMEFHADAISASVTGANHLVSSLQRLEMSAICFNTLLYKYQEWEKEQIFPENLYDNHSVVQEHYAVEHNLSYEHRVIGVDSSAQVTSKQRVKIKDQWASHPSLEQRISFLESLQLETEENHESPWSLFTDAKSTQEKFTKLLFKNLSNLPAATSINNKVFHERYHKDFKESIFPKAYHGFFNNYFPVGLDLDLDLDQLSPEPTELTQDAVLDKQKILDLEESSSIYNDLDLLQYIMEGEHDLKTFDFDGVKHKVKNAKEIHADLLVEAESLQNNYKARAELILAYFFAKAKEHNQGKTFRLKYTNLIKGFSQYEEDNLSCEKIREELRPVFEEEVQIVAAKEININVKKHEEEFKALLKAKISEGILAEQDYKAYLDKRMNYFMVDTFDESNIETLFLTINKYQDELLAVIHERKKDFLNFQLGIINDL